MVNASSRLQRDARRVALTLTACMWLLGGCVAAPQKLPVDALTGRSQLPEVTRYGIAPDEDVLTLNDDMRAFVVHKIKALRLEERAAALGRAFSGGGLLALRYDQEHTRTAAATYRERAGNCLSFSQLFVALARASGLHVRFREDRNVESWSRLGDVLLLNRHVTVWGIHGGDEYDVDFGRFASSTVKLRQLISDDRARAEYFNNLGAEAFAHGAPARAIPFFNRALLIEPTLGFAWTNLAGALRSLGQLHDADLALRVALHLDPESESALSGLERLYRAQGDAVAADRIALTVARYRDRNPYRHFQLAQEALRYGNYTAAIQQLQSALRISPNEPDFNFELGRAYLGQGNLRQAAKRFKRVEELAQDSDQSRIYAARLATLLRESAAATPPSS